MICAKEPGTLTNARQDTQRLYKPLLSSSNDLFPLLYFSCSQHFKPFLSYDHPVSSSSSSSSSSNDLAVVTASPNDLFPLFSSVVIMTSPLLLSLFLFKWLPRLFTPLSFKYTSRIGVMGELPCPHYSWATNELLMHPGWGVLEVWWSKTLTM